LVQIRRIHVIGRVQGESTDFFFCHGEFPRLMSFLRSTLERSKDPMPACHKIENIGVCPPEGFTVLGVSLADTSDRGGGKQEALSV
jgi:hypothetical protein